MAYLGGYLVRWTRPEQEPSRSACGALNPGDRVAAYTRPPLPIKATRRSFPNPRKHLQDPTLTASLQAGCVTAERQAEACRGQRDAIKNANPLPLPALTHSQSRESDPRKQQKTPVSAHALSR